MSNLKPPNKTKTTTIGGSILAIVLAIVYAFLNGNKGTGNPEPAAEKSAQVQALPKSDSETKINTRIGFASQRGMEEHFQKHGAEFGDITIDQYLRQAQTLRDSPGGGTILEAKRTDGVITRFDKKTGAFLAINPDETIRTFFRPNDGEKYFHRQAERQDDQP